MQNDKKFRGFSPKMNRFNQLLNSKYFLLVFVNTLEQQLREFSLHDRFSNSVFSPSHDDYSNFVIHNDYKAC